ncbi:hypothetical protein JL720_2544 [Aureococcus anophagefferens]|nr:hypothetical protein JL720_2544 [Aureococcus anophagefferens]
MIATLAAALADGAGLLPPRAPFRLTLGAALVRADITQSTRRQRSCPSRRGSCSAAPGGGAPRSGAPGAARGDAEFGPLRDAVEAEERAVAAAAAAAAPRAPALGGASRSAWASSSRSSSAASTPSSTSRRSSSRPPARPRRSRARGGPGPAGDDAAAIRGTRGFDPASTGAHATGPTRAPPCVERSTRAIDSSVRSAPASTRPSSSGPESGGDPPKQRSMSAQAAILAAAVAYAPKIPARPRRRAPRVGASSPQALFVTMALMDTWGRRRLLSTFVPAMGLRRAGAGRRRPGARRAGARGPGAAAASLAAISLYGVFFGLSLGPIPNIYTAVVPDGRDEGDSTSLQRSRRARPRVTRPPRRAAAQFASHAAVSFYFPVVVARRGPRAAFAAFAAVCGVTWVFVRRAVPGGPNLGTRGGPRAAGRGGRPVPARRRRARRAGGTLGSRLEVASPG